MFHPLTLSKYVHSMLSDEAMECMEAEMDWISPFWIISDDPICVIPKIVDSKQLRDQGFVLMIGGGWAR